MEGDEEQKEKRDKQTYKGIIRDINILSKKEMLPMRKGIKV